MPSTLEIKDLHVSIEGKQILKGVNLKVSQGEIHAIMGPNGSGKSTFLRLCALLETPDDGEVIYSDGAHILEQDIALRRMITLVLPRVGVFNTTVVKNVSYGLRIRGVKAGETEEKALQALEFVKLADKKGRNALTLSSGETQRLGIARAVVIEPAVLFLDEPTASVDQKNTEIIEEIILKMKKEGGSAVVITTHDPGQAGRLADYMLVMSEGELSRV